MDAEQYAARQAWIAEIDAEVQKLIAADGEQIRIWPFHSAPESFRFFMHQGGDEDWVALVPPAIADDHIGWLEMPAFGVCDVAEKWLPCGARLVVATHA